MGCLIVGVFAAVLGTLVLGIRMLGRIRQSKRSLFLVGFSYWLVLWTAFYVILNAVNPRPDLAGAVVILVTVTAIHIVILVALLSAKFQWAALGYVAAMALNIAGQFLIYNVVLDAKQVLVGDVTYGTRYIRDLSSLWTYLCQSTPFFLPVTYGL
jgi:hypothetical protein